MTVEDPNVIDLVSRSKDGGTVTLTIADPLEFGSHERLRQLEEKINSYIAFVESGELKKKFPEVEDATPAIHVSFFNDPDNDAVAFLKNVSKVLDGFHIIFYWSVDEPQES